MESSMFYRDWDRTSLRAMYLGLEVMKQFSAVSPLPLIVSNASHCRSSLAHVLTVSTVLCSDHGSLKIPRLGDLLLVMGPE